MQMNSAPTIQNAPKSWQVLGQNCRDSLPYLRHVEVVEISLHITKFSQELVGSRLELILCLCLHHVKVPKIPYYVAKSGFLTKLWYYYKLNTNLQQVRNNLLVCGCFCHGGFGFTIWRWLIMRHQPDTDGTREAWVGWHQMKLHQPAAV